jgi:hypothetical protein
MINEAGDARPAVKLTTAVPKRTAPGGYQTATLKSPAAGSYAKTQRATWRESAPLKISFRDWERLRQMLQPVFLITQCESQRKK